MGVQIPVQPIICVQEKTDNIFNIEIVKIYN